MATIYRRDGKKNRGGTYYVQYVDENGQRKTVRGCSDRNATLALARKIETETMLRKTGVIDKKADRYSTQGQRLISEHLSDWKLEMLSRGVSEKQTSVVYARVRRVFDIAGFRQLSDISPFAMQKAIAELKKTGRSAKTLNDVISSAKQFCTWARRDGRLSENPLEGLQRFNTALDRRHDRRALTEDELQRVITAAEEGPTLQHCSGPERALIYRFAVLTGLRANEIATLKKRSFNLENEPYTVTVEAAFSKHRRKDIQPLPMELIPRLKEHLATKKPNDLAFQMPRKPIESLRRDLEAAGVDYESQEGFADFHAFRHTFITRMIRAGVHPKAAQMLARHQDPSMTLRVYSHVELAERAAVLETMPRLEVGSNADKKVLEFGADVGTSVGSCATLPDIHRQSMAQEAEKSGDHKSNNMSMLDRFWHGKALNDTNGKFLPEVGIEPTPRVTWTRF